MNSFQKGQRIEIAKNSIFRMMGFETVTGTVFLVSADGKSIHFKCDQTRAIEIVDIDDGEIGGAQ